MATQTILINWAGDTLRGELRGGTLTVGEHTFPVAHVKHISASKGAGITDGCVELNDGTRLPFALNTMFLAKRRVLFSGEVQLYVDSLSKVVHIRAQDICEMSHDDA